jgi:hypothetical protein
VNFRLIWVAMALASVAAAWWWWYVRCERDCAAADHKAEELFRRGELLSALALIDAMDARCHCERFTSGDAPLQYTLARTCLRRLLSQGRSAEVEAFLTHVRGPILKELSSARVQGEK